MATKTDEKNKNQLIENNGNNNLYGVDKSLQDKAFNSTYQESDDVTQKKDQADSSLDRVNNLTSQDSIIDQETKDKMNQEFVLSDEWNQSNELTQGLFDKVVSGKTSYTDQIADLISQIQNREDFSYDVDTDPLFQQALASAMNSGRSAMQDTIGQASSLTGGYGSTYATSAGNQAYNAYIEDAYNNLPEYYQMALEAYQMEGEDMYNQLNMLNNADATEYGRMYNSWDASYRNTQDIWNREFNTWDAGVTQAFNSANVQLNEHGQLVNDAYTSYTANMDMYQTLRNNEYQSWADQVSQAQAAVSAYNSDAWNRASYNQTESWNQKNFDENQKQWNYSIGDTNNDGVVDDAEKAAMGTKEGYVTRVVDGQEVTFKEATTEQKNKALEVYNAGGEKAYNQYLDSLPSDVDYQGIDTFVHGNGESGGYGVTPLAEREFTVTGKNLIGASTVKDQYGNEYTADELIYELKKAGVDDKVRKEIIRSLDNLDKDATYKYGK